MAENGMMTPEEIETLRAYGVALLGTSQQPDQPYGSNPYARVSGLSPFVRGLQALQGRSTLNRVESVRGGQRQDLFSPTAGTTAPPTTGSITPPATDSPRGLETTPPTRTGASPDLTPEFNAYAQAIDTIEAGGNYGLRGPVITNPRSMYRGDRAYGRFQVMGRDIPRLTRQFYGRELTPEQFLADQAAQNAVFQGEFGRLVRRFGNPIDAAQAWFAGESTVGNPATLNRTDAQAGFQGTSVRSYRRRFASALSRIGIPRMDEPATVTPAPNAATPQASLPPPMRLGAGGLAAQPETQPVVEPTAQPETQPGMVAGKQGLETGAPPVVQTGAPADGPPSGQTTQPPQALADLIAQSMPSNTSRIQQLERMLQRAPMLRPEEALKLREEYDAALGPQEKDIPGFGKATFVYDPQQRRYVLDTFQPTPSVQQQTIGGLSTPNMYYYSRQRGGWQIVPQGRIAPSGGPPGTTAPATQPGATPGVTPPATTGSQPRLRLEDFPYGADPATQADWLSRYERQKASLESQSSTMSTIRDDVVKEAREAPVQRTQIESLLSALRRSNTWTGAQSQRFLELRRVLTNLGWIPAEVAGQAGLSNEELINMIQTRLGTMASRSLTSRPTQFDFSQMLSVSPGLANSPLGAQVMADYMRQEIDHRINIGRLVSRIPADEISTVNDVIDKYYRDNPITITIPSHTVGGQRVPEMRLSTINMPRQGDRNPNGGTYTYRDTVQFALDHIPNGMLFYSPQAGRFVTSDHARFRAELERLGAQ